MGGQSQSMVSEQNLNSFALQQQLDKLEFGGSPEQRASIGMGIKRYTLDSVNQYKESIAKVVEVESASDVSHPH